MLQLENISGFESWLLTHPFILGLLEELSLRDVQLSEYEAKIKELEEALAKKQGVPSKPDFGGASELDKSASPNTKEESKKATTSTGKRKKKERLDIHKEEFVKAKDVPPNWVLVKHSPVIIEDVKLAAHNVCYQLEVWRSPDGKKQITASFPLALQGSQFGPVPRSFVLSLYHDLGSTQPCIANFLNNIGVDISRGTINNMLIENQDVFHQEKEELLEVGKKCSPELRTDDTGAKHCYENYFTNCINTDYFTYFQTNKTKSRINFLEILRQTSTAYTLNQASLDYYKLIGCPKAAFELLQSSYQKNGQKTFEDKSDLSHYLQSHKITGSTTIRIITEGLLIGTIVEEGFDTNTIIHSDEAGQFALFVHSLCWKHIERPLRKLKTYTNCQAQQLEQVKKQFWHLYQRLKKYKENPEPKLIQELNQEFDTLCEHKEGFFHLNRILDNIYKKKDKMLLVLKRPVRERHQRFCEKTKNEWFY